MATYTDRNRFTKQVKGSNEGTWGDIVNTVLDLLDESLDGVIEIDVSAGNQTLTTNNGASDEARQRTIRLIGDISSARTLTLPDKEKNYFIEVATSGTGIVTIKNVSDSTGVSVASDDPNMLIYCDGTETKKLLESNSPTPFESASITTQTSAAVSVATSAQWVYSIDSALKKDSLSNLVNTIKNSVYETLFPVGALYFNYSDSTNPGISLGFGTWVAVAGRMLIGVGSGTDSNGTSQSFAAAATGGEYTHTLTTAEIPAHTHSYTAVISPFGGAGGGGNGASAVSTGSTGSAGSGGAHNNLPPYQAVYIWRRTA